MEFFLEWPDKLSEARAQPGHADGLNGFLPSVLIIRRHRKNLFEKHLRLEVHAVRRKFSAAIATQNSAAYDRGGQGGARDAREERRLLIFDERDGGERRTQHYAGMQPDSLDEGFVLPDDAQPCERRDDVNAGFARRLAHIGNERLVGFERHALLQLPPQHRNGFGCRAWEILKVLNEDANHRVGKDYGNIFIPGVQMIADIGYSGLNGGGVHDV